MITLVLIILLGIAGLIMIAGGIGGLVYLWNQWPGRVSLRHYAAVVGMICGGLAMWAIAQVLRIELAIFVLENAHR